MSSETTAHLQMIQAVVQRMAQNSFALKGWCVTVVVGRFALAAKDGNAVVAPVAVVPILTFGFMDAYYLWQERRFRSLFDAVAAGGANVPAFSMEARSQGHVAYRRSLISSTILAFYPGLLVATILLICLLKGGYMVPPWAHA